jgi:hypothetical protein
MPSAMGYYLKILCCRGRMQTNTANCLTLWSQDTTPKAKSNITLSRSWPALSAQEALTPGGNRIASGPLKRATDNFIQGVEGALRRITPNHPHPFAALSSASEQEHAQCLADVEDYRAKF